MRSVICMGCDQEVKVSLPDFGVETFDCDCGYMVVIDRFKSKYEIDHCDGNGKVVLTNTHYINKKVARNGK